MKRLTATSALLASLAVLPAPARAQDDYYAAATGDQAAPDAPAPQYTPPPPGETPAAPQAGPAAPPGQWVYTQQYGWIWMPYADGYTYLPPGGWGVPYAYVYYPAYAAWSWVAAPWIWGFGPWPAFGVWGPARFAWYAHGWWRYPARWHYAPAFASPGFRAPFRGGAGWSAPRFAPGRGAGWGAPRFAPGRGAGWGAPRFAPGRGAGWGAPRFAPGHGAGRGAPAFMPGRGGGGGRGGHLAMGRGGRGR